MPPFVLPVNCPHRLMGIKPILCWIRIYSTRVTPNTLKKLGKGLTVLLLTQTNKI